MAIEIHPLLARISGGESERLDFKKTVTSAAKIAKTLVAFANTRGGSLLIGVSDSGKITGTDYEQEQYMIESAAQVFSQPPVSYQLELHEYQGKHVLEVKIPESTDKPHAALEPTSNRHWAYVRVGDQTLLASPVVYNLLRKQQRGESARIRYDALEERLLGYLRTHGAIPHAHLQTILEAPRRNVLAAVTHLVMAGVLDVFKNQQEEFYGLAELGLPGQPEAPAPRLFLRRKLPHQPGSLF